MTTGKVNMTISITPKRWWKVFGLYGALIPYAGMRLGLPLGAFYKVEAT